MSVILASQSPRRQELLKKIITDFKIVPADIDEAKEGFSSPEEYVAEMALRKAKSIAEDFPTDLVIGCDTIVAFNGEILGKPVSEAEAFTMLEKLSGTEHDVYTSITLQLGERQKSCTFYAKVVFFDLTTEDIQSYLDTGEYKDKAGAYGIQGQGCLFVKEITGDFYTIVGLPISHLKRMIREFKQEEHN